jgi:MraZ protein
VAESGARWGAVGETPKHHSASSFCFLCLSFSFAMNADLNSAPIFSGEFRHALDVKNRVTVPSRWRSSEADEFFLIADRSGSFVRAMPPKQFRAVGEALASNPAITPKDRAVFLRHFYSRSQQVVLDKQGRLIVPEDLGKLLGLEGEVVLVGTHETFELWNPTAWAQTQSMEAATFDRVADLLGL